MPAIPFLGVGLGLAMAAFLIGCATPTIDRARFARPKTVAIGDFPDAKPAATIGILNARWPHISFTGPADPYFVPQDGQFTLPAVGSLIDASAQATQKKAEGYPVEVQAVMPDKDTRTDMLFALSASLEAKGITASILDDSRNMLP